ncbi:MAG: hypothetical protein HYZ91_00225 [Candidatus Omnitrophica bacterium]|nr:hypothetical protein [Candidatus Omnitrophota bacterium]
MNITPQRGFVYAIALTYNVRRAVYERDGIPFDGDSEFDSPKTIEMIANSLRANGHTVHQVEATQDLPQWFLAHRVDLVFNIAEGAYGAHRESQVPAILESLGVPFTGSNSVTLALALDKAKTKQILASEGIPTPPWQLFPTPTTPLNPRLEFPLIVKPNREGSSKGIWRESVVGDEPSLRRQVARIFERYHQEILVEEFIEGKELTAGVIGHAPLPVLEIDFTPCRTSEEFFYSWRMKEFQGDASRGLAPALHCPARLDGPTTARVQGLAWRTHRLLGCRDVSRTDIRLRADGTPFVLEVNPLPGLSPLDSNFPVMTQAAGFSHEALIQRIVALAMARYRHTSHFQSPVCAARSCSVPGGAVNSGEADERKGSATVHLQEPSASARSCEAPMGPDAGRMLGEVGARGEPNGSLERWTKEEGVR